MATHSHILPWTILWTEEPGGLQSVGITKRGWALKSDWKSHRKFPVKEVLSMLGPE